MLRTAMGGDAWRVMKCPSCQADHADSARFCTQCGTALPIQCSSCGAVSPPNSKFCGACGVALTTAQVPRPSMQGNADQESLAGNERRHLTVLFCDMVESTRLAKALDPEDLNDITRRFYECCDTAIGQFDGIIANYIGDGVMALFGYPRAHEDDAERAVRAALSIIGAIDAAPPKNGRRVRVRIGIATGLVVVGEDGAHALTKEKTVVGEAPNLAAHLQAAAKPGNILISEATRRLIGDVFVLEKLEIAALKPGRESAICWRIAGEAAVTSRFAAHVSSLTDFVGREQEVALLHDRWQQACQGEGQVVLLAGEAGIGKSRIVDAFCRQIPKEACFSLHYQCSPYHVDSSLHPIVEQLEHAADFVPADTPAVKLDKLEAVLKQATDRLEDVVPLLAALLSIPTGDRYPPPDPDPQRRKERTFNALLDQLAGLAARRPVLLILEDAHWSDPTSLDFFGRAVLRFPDMRVMLIVTYRPEFHPPWVVHPHVTALLLNRLGRRHCRAMVDYIARGKALPAEVLNQIIEKTDGVPLFIEELTKTVLESDLLQEKESSWQLQGQLPAPAIPATLQDSLMARLDRLHLVKDVAQIGATIGRAFSYDLLAAVSAMPEAELQAALNKLVGGELVFLQAGPPTVTYAFKHALVQDAAYDTMLRGKRQQLHGRIAKVLEARFPEVAATQPEIIAHHYTQAGLIEVAVDWWEQAGNFAIKRSADLEAVRHLSRAIELVRAGPKTREREVRELAIRIKLSGPLIATRGYVTTELAENYARASELCAALGENKSAFAVMYGEWVIPYVKGDMGSALANSQRFLRRAEEQGDAGLLTMGHRIYGSSLVWRGDTLAGSQHLKRALSMYRAPEHDQLAYVFSQHPRTAALAHLCLALQHLGHPDEAMTAGWEAISQAKQIQHFNSIAYSLCFVSLLIMLRRDIETLRKTAGELLQMSKQYNASYWALWAEPMLGWIDAKEGRIETGIRQMQASTEELRKQNANLWVRQTLLLESEIMGEAAQYERAHQLLDEAQALIEPLDQRFYEAELHRVRGVVMLAEGGDPAKAIVSLDRAVDVARHQNSRFLELRACVSKARLLRDQGHSSDARELLTPVYHSFSEGLDTVDLREARMLVDRLS